MKKLLLLIPVLLIFITTGCLKKDSLEDITIYTGSYPIEYIVDTLYGKHSNIKSIYPDGVDTNTYDLNKKQIKDYSKGDMFVFNGLTKEKDYLTSMFNYNKNLMIIDTTSTMEYKNHIEELWLDPSNFLMMSLNIKNGLSEYITNQYLKTEINNNYEELKLNISNIDAKIKLLNENSNKNTIVVDNNSFKFLEKYGFEIISLEENDELTDKTVSTVKNMIYNDKIKYIYTTNKNNLNNTVNKLVSNSNVEVIELYTISNLTDQQRASKIDYAYLLNENIELLKKELYR